MSESAPESGNPPDASMWGMAALLPIAKGSGLSSEKAERKTPGMMPFGARITVKWGENERTRVLTDNDDHYVAMCRGVVRGGKQGDAQVVNALFEKSTTRNLFTDKLLSSLKKQCTALCSTANPSLLRDTSPDHLNSLHLEEIVHEWKGRADLLYKVLAVIMGLEYNFTTQMKLSRKYLYTMVMGGSSLLFRRNPQLSLMQHAVGLMLDFGGTRNKTITALSNCGLTVSTSAIYEKRKQIEKYHDSKIDDKLVKQKNAVVAAAVSAVPCLPLPVYSITSGNVTVIRYMLEQGLFSNEPQLIPQYDVWDIYGDNLDFTINTFRQTMDKRSQSVHWFLLVGAPLRVIPPASCSQISPRQDIMVVPNHDFLPAVQDHLTLRENFVFHVMEVITKFIPFLGRLQNVVPKYIDHPHVDEISKKSEYLLLDVLDKSENSNDEMIDIMNHVHDHYVPYVPNAIGENTIGKIVFGGDLLTNERAYSAQLNMANGTSSATCLQGVNHRTEGLHLCMNTCQFILETFYSSSSVRDIGTLYHLKTLVDRRNLHLDMTTGYNQAKNFIDDALDSYIVAAALMLFGMESLEDEPTKNLLPSDTEGLKNDQKLAFLRRVSEEILNNIQEKEMTDHSDAMQKLEEFESTTFQQHQGRYMCHVTNCDKSFTSCGWLKRHLKKKHDITVQAPVPKTSGPRETFDGVFNYSTTFMRLALLFRDTRDAYKMGDGDRLMRNFKFLMLHFDQSTHIKYRLWLWRMLAYDLALLSEFERFCYRWNMSINVVGGARNCIANDNLVEIHVHKVKDLIRSMGANVNYHAVRRASKCVGTVKSLTEELGTYADGKHAECTTHRVRDIKEMSACLVRNRNLQHLPIREHQNYVNMAGDLLSKVDLGKLNDWLNTQKSRASREMLFN